MKAGCQLPLDIAAEIRRRVGDDFVLGIRMCWDEFLGKGGITPDLAAEQLEIFAGSGLFDYFNISGSAYPTLFLGTASMRVPQGYMIHFGKAAKEITGDRGAVWIVGRITHLEMAAQTVKEGAADMVCMSRAHLADPFLVKKTIEGRPDKVNRCVGINDCIGRLFEQREVICALNPVSGRERQWGDGTLVPVETSTAKKVVVVGGGFAGMKTASVAAFRGHHVVLLEREQELGGHIRRLMQLPTRGEWGDAIDNLRRAMANAGVDVRVGVEATADVLQLEQPDLIVWATGSVWDRSGFSPFDPSRSGMPGADQENVLDLGTAMARALEDPRSLGTRVVIADETGTYMPLGLAELLGKHKVDVEIVSPHLFIGEETMRQFDMQHLYPALRALGVQLTAQQAVDSISGRTVTVKDSWTGGMRTIEDVDTLVLSLMRIPYEGPLQEIRRRFSQVITVGDVVAPRKIAEIMYEGEKVGRSI
jgi:NADH:flavin oxidoreductase / NADH oxidase family/FAD dependent oxidoreductase